MTANCPDLRVERHGHQLTLSLDRPRARNALTTALMEAIVEEGTRAAADGARVLVLRGEGPAFSAGADLDEHVVAATLGVDQQHAAYARMSAALGAFEALPLIKLARLHGAVVGAGLVLASACELRIADSSTRFSVPEVALGIPFSMGGFPRLVRLIGLTRATAMMLTPTTMDAAEAERVGLVTRTVEPDALDQAVDETASYVAGLPDFLVADAVERIRSAADHLLPARDVDVKGLVLAGADPACRELSATYTVRVLGRRVASEARS
jgi:enoyl-CoA hydratase/carnithine racemase